MLDRPGQWSFAIEAWSDPMSTWHHAVTTKIEAGQGAEDLANDFEDGARLFDRLAKALPKDERARATAAARTLRDTTLDVAHRVAPALDDFLQDLAHEYPVRDLVTASPRYPLWIDRSRALFGSWYEFFPRSIGAELAGDPTAPARPARHGTFKDSPSTSTTSPSMGFDVVYLPPIHPIGEVNRKGPNNTLVAASWDVGSPWAIGSRDGGHDAIHPELGHDGRLHRAGEAGQGARHGDRASTSRCSARPTIRGSPSIRSGSPPVPTAASPTPRTRRRSTRTSTRSTSTTTRRASTPSACASCGTGSTPA